MIKTYTELLTLPTFEERFKYLKLDGHVGEDTFGFDRYINQNFYRSKEWKKIRDFIILRDNGCDLAVPGREIYARAVIHHMNPITIDDLVNRTELLMNPDFLITTSHQTHNAIHYGDESLLVLEPVERKKGDTTPWKKIL